MRYKNPLDPPASVGLTCPPPEKTQVQQHFKDECDIHTILRRIEGGGDSAILQARKGFYADLTDIPVDNLSDAYDAVATAEAAFDALPSDVRSNFDNDPGQFLAYVDEHGVDSVAALFGEKPVMRDGAAERSGASDGAVPPASTEQ